MNIAATSKLLLILRWPSQTGLKRFIQVYKAKNSTVTQEMQDQYARDYLRLKVYFESLTVSTIKEEPVYEGSSKILSEIGGAVSLYLGASAVVVLEVFEIGIRLAAKFWGKL